MPSALSALSLLLFLWSPSDALLGSLGQRSATRATPTTLASRHLLPSSRHARPRKPRRHAPPQLRVDRDEDVGEDGLALPSAERASEEMLFGIPREPLAQPLFALLSAQLILFIGVGAVIPTLPLYGKAIGLSSAVNGVVIAAPAVALLLGARLAGAYADQARKPAMVGGMALIVAADTGTALADSLLPLLCARLALGAGRCVSEAGERGMLADLAEQAPELRGRVLAAQQAHPSPKTPLFPRHATQPPPPIFIENSWRVPGVILNNFDLKNP